MNIETAKNVQSLMAQLNVLDSNLKRLNEFNEIGIRDGGLSLVLENDCVMPFWLNCKEMSEVLNFLSSYYTLEKYKIMKEIEEL